MLLLPFIILDSSILLVGIGIATAALYAFYEYVTQKGVMWLVRFLAVLIFLVPIITLNTASVQVIDKLNPYKAEPAVDNVPNAMAFIASITSSMTAGVVDAVTESFHTEQDPEYNSTGMMYGSKLYRLANSYGIQNSNTREEFTNYLQNCIFNDISRGKYTWHDLANSTDIWQFIANHNPSPLLRVPVYDSKSGGQELMTCAEAGPVIKNAIQSEEPGFLQMIGVSLYGNNAEQYQTRITNGLTHLYSQLTGMSQTSSQILLQNMTIIGIQQGQMSLAGMQDNSAAALNYATAKTQMSSIATFWALGQQAYTLIPMLVNALFMLLLSISIIVFSIACIPRLTLKIVGNYFFSFCYLSIIPIIFVFVDYMSSVSMIDHMSGIIQVGKQNAGITLSNFDPLKAQRSEFTAICGYILSLTPFLARAAVTGMAGALSSMAQIVNGVMHSAAGGAAGEAVSGNYNLDNISMHNQSMNNVSANKHDTSFLNKGSEIRTDFGMGGLATTTYGDGTQIFAAPQSSLSTNVNWGQALSQSISHQHADAQRMVEHDRTAYNQSLSQS